MTGEAGHVSWYQVKGVWIPSQTYPPTHSFPSCLPSPWREPGLGVAWLELQGKSL